MSIFTHRTPRRRSRLIVEIDLDPVPGWGHTEDDHVALLAQILRNAVPHYSPTVTVALPHVYVVTDAEGERTEVYTDEETAHARVQEINAKVDTGFAFYDTHELLTEGARPTSPHHGI